MKILKYIYDRLIITFSISAILMALSCDDDFLEEIPRSFLSPEITFTNTEGFKAGLTGVYSLTRALFLPDAPGTAWSDRDDLMSLNYGTDIGWYWDKKNFFGDYSIINPSTNYPSRLWNLLYIIIKDANVIITRAENEDVDWSAATDKEEVIAEARFYRAFAYRYLVYHFGGVPIIEGEITGAKLDFVRATKEQVLDFMVADLQFASQNLPVENPNDGHVVKAAADHLLSETYISTGDYDLAIQAATAVIDDGQYALMRDRFGTFSDQPGDVFWDLFRYENQNNPANTEVIWTAQVEFNVPGGAGSFNRTERAWGPFMDPVRTPDGLDAILKDEFWGRPVGFIRPSVFLDSTVWESDFNNDMRNSSHNMQREFIINNPASAHFGEVIVPTEAQKVRNVFVYIKKASMPNGRPQGYDPGGRIYTDIYIFRLAETYLLRAEAHLRNGDNTRAANDINTVRSRANATPVDPGDVDIHYVLDERVRELIVEEPRQLTLRRVGLLGERIQMYNPVSGPTFTFGRDELLPIPQAEIDANTEAELIQNPEYN
ncbi:RagB/SusD family nutrient uptake outer membrane protein [Cyclobacterium roseum]|uniref:RagB/SusD family nutrient uptake outer membrane protein n=1 Tax=Cyclobacterium roseum TaxID=2666137 RepID=UPI001390B556|nr:RagB/SusD family nutrient uptake outer membrane protein [Cyclobacterium roseum]